MRDGKRAVKSEKGGIEDQERVIKGSKDQGEKMQCEGRRINERREGNGMRRELNERRINIGRLLLLLF